MFFWYIGGSVLAVLVVFRCIGIDYRLIAVGSLIPLAIDLPWRRLGIGHTLLLTVFTLVVVMLGTIGRKRLLRRRLLCIPIGMFCGLVLSAVWRFTAIMWWPTLGWKFPYHGLLGPWWVVALEELAGLIAIWIVVGMGSLYEKRYWQQFMRTGRIEIRPEAEQASY